MNPLMEWMESRGWTTFAFQQAVWDAYLRGASGLLHAPTGSGKTLAAWGGALLEWLDEDHPHGEVPSLRVLWLTPLRALANDTAASLCAPLRALSIPWTVELRTGDTSQAVRRRQREKLPSTLVTTPESLSLLLSMRGASKRFSDLRAIVVDEWHELLGTKRGVQTELCLARLRSLAPGVRTWGLSATLGNVGEAADVLLGMSSEDAERCVIRGAQSKDIEFETILPDDLERFPWAGHIGLRLLDEVINRVEGAGSTLAFTNTRSQAEIWFHAMIERRPDLIGSVAIHHGSLDREIRERVEEMLRDGALRCVVCTSSLDLGVDFTPVEQVIQIGSPKGIARLLQRAGRSGHQPGAVSRVIGVPTNALELIEFSAARDAIESVLDDRRDHHVEMRTPLHEPLDVLAQHLVTVGLGDGFDASSMRAEVRRTHAYRGMSDEAWRWTLEFVSHGGASLAAYPQYAKLERDERGLLRVSSQRIARMHRMSIGTITADTAVRVRFRKGATLGTIEERFISRLRKGDRFFFAGRFLELVMLRDMTAYVKTASGRSGAVPRWMGGKSPLSTQLARGVRRRLAEARADVYVDREMALVRPLLELQSRWSIIPEPDELLIERARHRGIQHIFVFSFAGRLVHEGLTALVGYRMTQMRSCTLSMSSNDWGFEFASRDPLDFDETEWRRLLSPASLLDDLLACLNATELARRRFRSIAQIAGLVFSGYPGQGKSNRQMQASSDLFFDVFQEFDPANLLLDQSRREVLERELEFERLRLTLESLQSQRITIHDTARFTPLAFPLWVESIRTQQVSSERWQDRVERMVIDLERRAAAAEERTEVVDR